jgi:hypothetical protein
MQPETLIQSGYTCINCYQLIREPLVTRDVTKHYKPADTHLVARTDTTERAACDSPEPKACADCGDIDGYRRRPVSRQTLLRYSANLSQALEAYDIRHDHILLLAEVDERKSDPENSQTDDEIITDAAERAIQET